MTTKIRHKQKCLYLAQKHVYVKILTLYVSGYIGIINVNTVKYSVQKYLGKGRLVPNKIYLHTLKSLILLVVHDNIATIH